MPPLPAKPCPGLSKLLPAPAASPVSSVEMQIPEPQRPECPLRQTWVCTHSLGSEVIVSPRLPRTDRRQHGRNLPSLPSLIPSRQWFWTCVYVYVCVGEYTKTYLLVVTTWRGNYSSHVEDASKQTPSCETVLPLRSIWFKLRCELKPCSMTPVHAGCARFL